MVGTVSLNELAKDINAWAVGNGFYETERNFGEMLMLIVSEAAEALEEYRNGCDLSEVYYHIDTRKPEGIPTELADILIRTLDLMYHLNIDIDTVVAEKVKYNKTRSYRNGGKLA